MSYECVNKSNCQSINKIFIEALQHLIIHNVHVLTLLLYLPVRNQAHPAPLVSCKIANSLIPTSLLKFRGSCVIQEPNDIALYKRRRNECIVSVTLSRKKSQKVESVDVSNWNKSTCKLAHLNDLSCNFRR